MSGIRRAVLNVIGAVLERIDPDPVDEPTVGPAAVVGEPGTACQPAATCEHGRAGPCKICQRERSEPK